MSGRPALSTEERLAIQAELELLHKKHGSDQAVAAWLGCAQQSVHRARTTGQAGPIIANAIYELLGVSREVLLAKYRALRPRLDAKESGDSEPPEPILELPPDKFPNRALAARRALKAKQWGITLSAIEYVCTAPEWQSPRFSTRDAVFWVEQMKVQTTEEARAIPATEEERIFQEALRALHAKRAKKRQAEERAAARARARGGSDAIATGSRNKAAR
jgi:hypothetical protein